MTKTIGETYSELWHYTTAAGLKGIIETQQLHATQIHYLNDHQEFSGFLDTRLKKILTSSVDEAKSKDASLGPDFDQKVKRLFEEIRRVTLGLDAFVTSFCSTDTENGTDGLLSQWRGYGKDGGYAVVFESKSIEKMINDELEKFLYYFIDLGNVDYYEASDSQSLHSETQELEAKVRGMLDKVLLTIRDAQLENRIVDPIIADAYEALVDLCVRHKHYGFREEKEVRITALRFREANVNSARDNNDSRPLKTVGFRDKNGILVPYIALFGKGGNGNLEIPLPIIKIIVGPHHDIKKRSQSVEALLAQNNISAQVIESKIPYAGS
jgi:hypothetical protein